jgi:hypothetical protein
MDFPEKMHKKKPFIPADPWKKRFIPLIIQITPEFSGQNHIY